jgi:NADPH:quinone reductase-like Zn-dependent oxidoreductase
MRALVLNGHGGLDRLSLATLPDPEPGPGEVRVRLHAAALNHLDVWVRKGWPQLKLTFPHVMGSDMAGIVDAVGPGAPAHLHGRRVVVVPGLSCGACEFCLAGNDNLCRDFRLLGEHVSGGEAELICVPAANVLPLPDAIDFQTAAALPVTFQTAWHMLTARAPVGPGTWLLVHAAGSGVGSAAVQIGRLVGATVIATAGSDEKCARALALGADHVINYERQDFSAEVRRLTDKRGVDVVFEHTGEATWERSLRSLRQGGKLVTCGATTGPVGNLDLRFLFTRQIDLLGSTMGTRAELATVLRHVAAGKLRPVIDRVLPLSEALEAQTLLETRQLFGKLLLDTRA